jgi:formylglycine-generating enzyme required for sulfatase activity
MSYCINPSCSDPAKNSKNAYDCTACGASLRLKNRYRAQKLLGQGGFGKTFKAIDEDRPGQPLCVIKQFAFSSDNPKHQQMALKLFYEEAQHLQSLGSHPQIPELLAYFDVDGQPYLVQQYIDGQDLEQELATEGAFSQQKIRELLESLLPVLDFLHNQSRPVIHRDIKPANIIRRRQDQALILVDFGAAKQATQTMLAKTGTTIGSPEFAAPEQTRGKPAFASDIYSLGVTCIHLLTAISPFDLFDTSQDDWVWRDYLLNNRVDGSLGKVLDKSIVNAVGRRYQSAAEMLAALNNRAQPAAAKPQASYVPPMIDAADYRQDQREKFSFETVYLIKGSRQVTETKKVLKPNWWGVGSKEVEESHTKKVNDWQVTTKSGQADRLIEDLGNKVQLEMVKIPGGEFLMGAPSSEHTSRENERPQHLVKIPRFYLGRYPITQEQYGAIMGNNPSQCTGDRLPVENVDWNDAQLFCQRLTAYTQKNYRLPTEAEWEYACRARTTTPFCFGETISTKLANYNGKLTYGSGIQGEYQSKATPVGDFPPNGFGLCDMHGNLWEWCADSWHDNYSGAPIDGSAWTGSASRVLRGGSWFVNPSACRSAYRGRANPGDSDAYIGLRVAYMP